jgi:hypothetical protein
VERARWAIATTGPQRVVTTTVTNVLAKYLKRHEGIDVSHNFIARLWREHGLKPLRQGTFKVSRDPEFAAKVDDIVGLYLDPPAGAGRALDRREDPGPKPCGGPSRCCR